VRSPPIDKGGQGSCVFPPVGGAVAGKVGTVLVGEGPAWRWFMRGVSTGVDRYSRVRVFQNEPAPQRVPGLNNRH